jgi:very-short-patch-repair endonuclease
MVKVGNRNGGSIHKDAVINIHDQERPREIEELGITVVRLTYIKNNFENILKQISKKIEKFKKY